MLALHTTGQFRKDEKLARKRIPIFLLKMAREGATGTDTKTFRAASSLVPSDQRTDLSLQFKSWHLSPLRLLKP